MSEVLRAPLITLDLLEISKILNDEILTKHFAKLKLQRSVMKMNCSEAKVLLVP